MAKSVDLDYAARIELSCEIYTASASCNKMLSWQKLLYQNLNFLQINFFLQKFNSLLD